MSCRCTNDSDSLKRGDDSEQGMDDDDPVAVYADHIEKTLESIPFPRDPGASMEAVRSNAGNVPRNMQVDTLPSSASSFQESEFVLILAACCIGISTGFGVVVFNDAVAGIRHYIWGDVTVLDGRQLLERIPWDDLYPRLLLPPVFASFLVGCISLITKRDDSSRQSRTLVEKIGRIVSSIVGLGSGVSLGPEGPSVEIGVDVSQVFVERFQSGKKHIASLIAAGSGAGVAAGFNAPISGVFFAVESVLQREKYMPNRFKGSQEKESSGLSIAMVLLASVLAAVVSQAGLGSSPAFLVPDYSLESLYELPLYLVFGGVCGVVSSLFLYSMEVATQSFSLLAHKTENSPSQAPGQKTHSMMHNQIYTVGLPVAGGLITGLFALRYPEILYEGFDNVNSVLSAPRGDYNVQILVQIVLLKIVATSICRGSGLKGGIYAPSIFMGAALGSAFGLSCQSLGDIVGMTVSPPQAFALVGVGAMLASACDVPLTSILLLFELTRDYLIILPTLAAVGISYWVSSSFLVWKRSSFPQALIGKSTVGALVPVNIAQSSGESEYRSDYTIINQGTDLTIAQICALLEDQEGSCSRAIITDIEDKEIAKVILLDQGE